MEAEFVKACNDTGLAVLVSTAIVTVFGIWAIWYQYRREIRKITEGK